MPQLSCEQCRVKKTKCDKKSPTCTACANAGVRCQTVQRARLPRGRSGKARAKNVAIELRVGRLEALLQRNVEDFEHSANRNDKIVRDCDAPFRNFQPKSTLDTYVASEFWSTLSDEIAGIRETLEGSDGDDDVTTTGNDSNTYHDYKIGFEGLVSRGASQISCSPAILPSSDVDYLLSVYRERVDTVFRPLHWPSALETLRCAMKDRFPGTGTALLHVVCYMAVCSLSDEECTTNLGFAKRNVVERFRATAEYHISAAKVLEIPDVVGLQSFIVYLQAIRASGHHALNWTLLAIAVRLGRALGLGRENASTEPPLLLQVRRRLWYCICLMDVQATLDRGAAPLVSAHELGPAPLDVDDETLATHAGLARLSPDLNEMSFCTMTFEAMVCYKKILAVEHVQHEGWQDWYQKIELLEALRRSYQQRYLTIEPHDTAPLPRLRRMAASAILTDMELLLRRPPYVQQHNTVPPWDHFDSLKRATESLERHMYCADHGLQAWAWKEWTPWYALAVVLAELCRTPIGPQQDRAFSVAYETYKQRAVTIDDPDQGMLWKPITRLLRRATTLRARFEARTAVLTPSATNRLLGGAPRIEGLDIEPSFTSPALGYEENRLFPPDTAPGPDEFGDSALDLQMLDFQLENGIPWIDWDELLLNLD
jgi:hypothetical protein